ncbi:MAG: PIG-L family deacetylase [Brumimicrobium sp.]|nr:PIG-L family deacetylase [Brumimicrobium sp.]
MKIFSILIGIFFTQFLFAQTSPEFNSAQILHELKKLNTVGSVLYIAAHPDDENTRLIAYLTNELHLRTGYLSLTRGDGGQNLIGTEQGEALGLIRTQELLAARRVDGAEQFFTRANDFGFSKNPEETLSIWDKEEILSDVVWTIRQFKPDVIICRFPTTGEGGHGHHTTSAILAEEAFDAAANPNRFPEQLKEVSVWQAKRLFWNTYNFGMINTTSSNQMKMDVGVYNPLLGKSYGEIASMSRSQHKSQGFGVAMQRGEEIEYFKFLKGDSKPDKDLFEGINFKWDRFTETAYLDDAIQKCIAEFNPSHPENSLDQLIGIYKVLDELRIGHSDMSFWVNQKLAACKNLIIQCAGLWMEAYPKDYTVVPGNTIQVTAQILVRNPVPVQFNAISFFKQTNKSMNKTLKQNIMETIEQSEKLPGNLAYSNPYWLNQSHSVGMYSVNDQMLIGKPENDFAEKVVFDITIKDLNLQIERGLSYKYTDPVKGEVYRPMEVLPPATVNISSNVWVFSSTEPKKIEFKVKANQARVKGLIQVKVPEGWTLDLEDANFEIAEKNGEAQINGYLHPSDSGKDGKLEVSLLINERTYTKSITRIEYDHIPYQFFLSDATAQLVHLDLVKTGTKIGYIPGAGDKVADNLKQIGYEITILNNEDLDKIDLAQFDAIVTGIRAYNVNTHLHIYHEKLMNYVHTGGNLIVQYNTNNRIAPLKEQIGPFPFEITNGRVTDETAEVKFNNPKASVLNVPNKITEEDFKGWIQERGLYFADKIDRNYDAIFSMHDKGEKDLKGSLIIGKYGKGNFVYTGLAFFRELPAGVPGAYRLFVNLLSLPQN